MNQFGAQKFSFKKPLMILMFIGIGIGSVSADMKKILSAIYRIGRFEKWDLSVLIGIGRYEKKLIGRTLKYNSIISEFDYRDIFLYLVIPIIHDLLYQNMLFKYLIFLF